MKEIIESILREEGLLPSDGPAVFSAMGKILWAAAELTKKNEPYATKTIQELTYFSCQLDDMESFVEKYS